MLAYRRQTVFAEGRKKQKVEEGRKERRKEEENSIFKFIFHINKSGFELM